MRLIRPEEAFYEELLEDDPFSNNSGINYISPKNIDQEIDNQRSGKDPAFPWDEDLLVPIKMR